MAFGGSYAGRDVISVSGTGNTVTTGAAGAGSAPSAGVHAQRSAPDARSIFVAVDMVGYSRVVASDHRDVQRDLRDVVERSATDARLPYERWIHQPQGDGVLSLAPLDDEPRYIDDFAAYLVAHLHRRNRGRAPESWLRLRVGLDQGLAGLAANGFTGEAAILACRLRDAAVTRRALAESGAALVLAVSDQMFQDNVGQDRTRVTAAEFRRVEIHEPKIDAVAWLWLPLAQP